MLIVYKVNLDQPMWRTQMLMLFQMVLGFFKKSISFPITNTYIYWALANTFSPL